MTGLILFILILKVWSSVALLGEFYRPVLQNLATFADTLNSFACKVWMQFACFWGSGPDLHQFFPLLASQRRHSELHLHVGISVHYEGHTLALHIEAAFFHLSDGRKQQLWQQPAAHLFVCFLLHSEIIDAAQPWTSCFWWACQHDGRPDAGTSEVWLCYCVNKFTWT